MCVAEFNELSSEAVPCNQSFATNFKFVSGRILEALLNKRSKSFKIV